MTEEIIIKRNIPTFPALRWTSLGYRRGVVDSDHLAGVSTGWASFISPLPARICQKSYKHRGITIIRHSIISPKFQARACSWTQILMLQTSPLSPYMGEHHLTSFTF